MKTNPHRWLPALLGWSLMASPLAGQRLVDDWLVRTGAGPGALQTGSTAAFWNPAGAGALQGRGSLMVLELLAPAATGVNVLAFSGSWRLDQKTVVAVGYQHLGIDGIDYTGSSPDDGFRLDVSQDLFAAAAARRITPRLLVGAGAQYLHSSEALAEDAQLGVGAGVRLEVPLPVPVRVGSYAFSVRERTVWGVGVELAPTQSIASWHGAFHVGVNGGQAVRGTAYRTGLTLSWRDVLELGGSLVGEPDAEARQWEPVVSGVVRLSRYELGVVREWLPNSFGGVSTFRFGIGL